jgi:CubicO group peptidase (beta-lactamase class C family)
MTIRVRGMVWIPALAITLGIISASQVMPDVSPSPPQGSTSKASSQDRISRLENGLIVSPVIIPGQPLERSPLSNEMNSNKVPGLSVAVIDDFRVAWAKGYGVTDVRSKTPVTPETLFCAGGISKFVTAVGVLRLVQENKLDLDEDVNRLLIHWKIPANQFTSGHPVTIRELLSHSAGVNRHRPSSFPPSEQLPDLLELIKGGPSSFGVKPLDVVLQPGGRFDYSSGGFLILQQLLIDVENQPFPEIMRRLVLDPAGMKHSTYDQPTDSKPEPARASGHSPSTTGRNLEAHVLAFPELAGSGLWTTASDLAALVINLQRSGEPGSLLSRSSYEILVHQVVSNAGLGVFVVGDVESRRFRVRTSDSTVEDTFTGWLVGYVHGGKGAVVLANAPTAFPVGFSLIRSIALEYNWNDYENLQPTVIIDANVYKQYVGRYQLGENVVTVSTSEDGQTLLRQIGDSEKVSLYPYSATTFLVSTELLNDARIRFVFNTGGKVTGLVLEYLDRGKSFTAPRLQ